MANYYIIRMVKIMEMLDRFNININNDELLNEALTHTSYSHEHPGCISYERLEYLGDAVLELVMSDYLYKNTLLPEGLMSKKRSEYVCEEALYEYAKELNLESYIKVGNGLDGPNRSIVADVFEAMIGTIYLEAGIDKIKEIFNEIILPHIENGTVFLSDYKSVLQELVQTDKGTVSYVTVSESGPAHNKIFEVDVIVDGIVFGHGIGHSKKEAEQQAAKDAYNKRAH